ncbi:hypothetical protein H6P81_004193 [Aristolochia fimbriata]|uniref:non-specific serine/threonine protein kinase n=1 Tax=Aristolochia fimbriata TaxID=158543 RepID=A0AAV7FH80_ARIFI|nr:hypothetical protein H6P81_004193 [Aristolochia fimbriata]
MTLASSKEEYSDYDSSCDSSHGWISDFSFGSSSSVSVSSSLATDTTFSSSSRASNYKPHKANQAHWEAIRRLRRADGSVGLHDFRLLRRLGSGDIGNVYLCRLRNAMSECLYAMKVVDREALAVRNKLVRAEMEKEIIAMLDHPFLPTLYAQFDASHYSCLVMEFCPGGDLHAARQRQPSRRFSVSSAKFYAAETLLALEYLHMMGVVYRDLKPENVLVREDGHIMLSDFDLSLKCDVVPKLLRTRREPPQTAGDRSSAPKKGSTHSCVGPLPPVLSCFTSGGRKLDAHPRMRNKKKKLLSESMQEVETELVAEPINARSKSFVGTHEYLAPEVISGGGHGSAVDWWTLGVFLFELLYGTTPFKGENNEKTLVNIIKQPLTFPKMSVIKSSSSSSKVEADEELARAQDLISKLLVKNPKKRLGSSKGSVEIKRHEFFRGVNWALIRSVRPPESPCRDSAKKINNNTRNTSRKQEMRDATYEISQHFEYF